MSQEAFAKTLIEQAGLSGEAVYEPKTPYRSDLPIDTISEDTNVTPETQHKMTHLLQQLIGWLNWLAISTQPDITPVTNFIAKYSIKASSSHIQAAKHVIRTLRAPKQRELPSQGKIAKI